MKSLGFANPGGEMPFAGTGEICAKSAGRGGAGRRVVSAMRAIIQILCFGIMANFGLSLLAPTLAQAATVVCTGGPLTANATDISVAYDASAGTCAFAVDRVFPADTGDMSFWAIEPSISGEVLDGRRKDGAFSSGSGFWSCDMGAGEGDQGTGSCNDAGLPTGGPYTATLSWDAVGGGAAPGATPTHVMTVSYSVSAGKNVTINSAFVNTVSPEINLKGNSVNIFSGDTTPAVADHTDFGSAAVTGGTVTRTFTIENLSGDTLIFGANAVSITGSGDFTVSAQPPTTLAPGSFNLNTTTFQITFDPSSNGTKTATVSINNNDADENPYTFAIQGTGTGGGAATGPEIAVTGNGVQIADGDTTPDSADHTDFGVMETAAGTVSRTFTITNSGDATLNLGANAAALSGTNAGDFTVTTQPAETVAANGGTTTVVVQFDPSATGARTATLSIENDDADESPFDFAIQGVGADGVTSQMITDFLGARNNFILNNQPDGGRRIERLNNGGGSGDGTAGVSVLGFAPSVPSPVDFSIANGRLSYAASASEAAAFLDARTGDAKLPDIGKWDIWSEGSFDLFTDNVSQSGVFGIVHVGADTLVAEDILLGLKLQVDWMKQSFAATSGTVTGLGAMAGPYATIALTDNFYLDISGAWGMSGNDISPFGTYTDRFWTSRILLDASLISQFEIDNWTIRPTLSASYINETSQAYTDSLGVPIPSRTVAQGEISFAPRVSYSFDLEDGATLTPWAEAIGQYAIQTAGSSTAGSYASALLGLSGSIGAGVDILLPTGLSLTLAGDYGGIGARAESYGAKAGISAPIK